MTTTTPDTRPPPATRLPPATRSRAALGLTAAMTVVIIGYYVLDIVNQFK